MTDVYLGVGSNLGDKQGNIRKALDLLQEKCEVRAVSSLYNTEPVGFADQDWFLNGAVKIETELAPGELRFFLRSIEERLGKKNIRKNGPRTIDLDILFYGNRTIDEVGLTIPHPRLHERLFVLAPLEEICPDFVHPLLNRSVRELKSRLKDKHKVKKLSAGSEEMEVRFPSRKR